MGRFPHDAPALDPRKQGYDYFLELFVLDEVLEGWEERAPLLEERIRVAIYYAEHDAWPPTP